jgi:hypothetical protein
LAETEAKLAKRKPAIEEEHAKLGALTEQRHQLQNQRRVSQGMIWTDMWPSGLMATDEG